MEQRSELKSARLLEIYTRLEQGRTLKKADLAQEFHVTQRSIQRDVEDLRCFLAERHLEREVIYDGKQRGYRMVSGNPRGLTNSEILAVCKILLESRSLPARDMGGILDIHYLPDYDLLFVTTADTQGLAGGNQLIYDALYDEILPFIQADPLPEDQKTHTELLSVLSSLAIAPLGDSAMTAAVTSQVSGKRYMFKPNSSEFTNFTADFTNDEGCFTFTLHGRPCSIHFGFGKLVCGQFPV